MAEEKSPAAKAALAAFIMSLVGFCISYGWCVGGIASIVLGALSLKKLKAAAGCEEKPYSVFMKIAKPFAIVDIVLGAIMVVVYLILTITCTVAAAALY